MTSNIGGPTPNRMPTGPFPQAAPGEEVGAVTPEKKPGGSAQSGGLEIRQKDGVPHKVSQTLAQKSMPTADAVGNSGSAATFREVIASSKHIAPAQPKAAKSQDAVRSSLADMGVETPQRAKSQPSRTGENAAGLEHNQDNGNPPSPHDLQRDGGNT